MNFGQGINLLPGERRQPQSLGPLTPSIAGNDGAWIQGNDGKYIGVVKP
jgi:hypothetical protein